MAQSASELTQAQYEELLSQLDQTQAALAKKAWVQIRRYKKAGSPLSPITLMLFSCMIWSAYKQVGFTGKLIVYLLVVGVLYIFHSYSYRSLKEQQDQAWKILHQLHPKT